MGIEYKPIRVFDTQTVGAAIDDEVIDALFRLLGIDINECEFGSLEIGYSRNGKTYVSYKRLVKDDE